MSYQFSLSNSDSFELEIPSTAIPITISGWFRRTSTTAMAILSVCDKNATARLQLTVGTSSAFQINSTNPSGGTSTTASVPGAATSDLWHWCAGVFVSNSSRFGYIDNSSVESTASNSPGNLNCLVVGSRYNSGSLGGNFSGQISHVGVWNRALSTDELKALRAGFSPSRVSLDGLLVEFPLIRDLYESRGRAITTVGAPSFSANVPMLYP